MSVVMNKEIIMLVIQFLEEEKFKDALHCLERESGLLFNMNYFEDSLMKGEWDKVEKYLLGFTKFEDNRYSMKIFFDIRKQKYLEALDKNDYSSAIKILREDLKVFASINEDIFQQLTSLLSLRNFRENEILSRYSDEKTSRAILVNELKRLIEANPVFENKLQFPATNASRLRTLINQSLNWQHQLCKSPKPNPDIKTLFVDHTCGQPNSARTPSPATNPLIGPIPRVGGSPLTPHVVIQTPLGQSLGGWMSNLSSAPHQVVPAGPSIVTPNNAVSMLKRPRTPPTNNPAMDYQTTDSELVLKRTKPFGLSEEVNTPLIHMFPVTHQGQSLARTVASSDDLPKTVVANLNQGSGVKTMDFHPLHQTLLLVGTNIGDIAIWEVSTREMLVLRNFKVWELGKRSMTLQATLANEYAASVNRVLWSPDGALLGVAYSKHIVQVYCYHGGEDVRNHLEIEAHVDSVSDIAFTSPKGNLCIVTSGEDKTIKVWDVADGTKLHMFEGHAAPVYSLCPHTKQDVEYIFSTGIDGKIKAWLYDNAGSRVDYDAPGQACVRMAYNTNGSRLFSCGTNREGESFLLEWNDSVGSVIRTYHGLGKRSTGVVQFTTSTKFLAVGDESAIKYWDMDTVNVLATIDAEGGLPASPTVRFSMDGMLLAVSTNENGVKILANADGIKLIRSIQTRTLEAECRITSGPAAKHGDGRIITEIKARNTDERGKSNIWKLTELEEPSQLRSLKLPDNLMPTRICRLTYTNSGRAILALTSSGEHKLWRWPTNLIINVASVDINPKLWRPSSGELMNNDVRNLEEAIHCFALSKNDSYVISSSGGKVSLFNMSTFKTMTSFSNPPPAAISLAFLPEDNNIIAVGTDESYIQIYNVRLDEITHKLRGHEKRVTGLAFSSALKVLVSSGADAQLFVWSIKGWEKETSKFLPMPSGRNSAPTQIQFHADQVHLLVVHESQMAIYEAPELELVKQWVLQDSTTSIIDATYSCDSQSIYAIFHDGSVSVFIANSLKQRCRISPTAYIPSNLSFGVRPLVVAAHPKAPNQFAVGLSDGEVYIVEPLPEEGNWGTEPPVENGVGPSSRSV